MTRGLVPNWALQSEAPSLAPWAVANATPTYGYVAPAPTLEPAPAANTGVLLVDSGTGYHSLTQAMPVGRYGLPVMVSIFARYLAGTGWIAIGDLGGLGAGAYFNVSTGALGTPQNGGRSGMRAAGNGWWRCWSYGMLVSPTVGAVTATADNANPNYVGTGSEQVVFGGTQIEPLFPGQMTPGAYVLSGATPGMWPRDPRQNLFLYSDDLTKWTTQAGTATVTAGSISGATAPFYTLQSGPAGLDLRIGSWLTLQLELMADAACTVPIMVGDTSSGYSIAHFAVTTAWKLFLASSQTTATDGTAGGFVGSGEGLFPVGRTVSVRRAVLSQCNGPADYVQTAGGIWCPSGAPRGAAI